MAARPSLNLLIGLPPLVILLDQLCKWWVLTAMDLHQSTVVIPGLFSLTSVRNPGAAFGIFSTLGPTLRMALLVGVSLLALVLLTVFYLNSRPHEGMARFAAALVMGGAVGNLIDRLRLGEVVDFLDFYILHHHWPAFNIADSAITIGISLFAWSAWRDRNVPDEISEKTPEAPTAVAKSEGANSR